MDAIEALFVLGPFLITMASAMTSSEKWIRKF